MQIRNVNLDEQGKIIPPPADSAKDTTGSAKPDDTTAGSSAGDKTTPAAAPHKGTLIDEVFDDTPSQRAKLQSGDLITKVNNKDVEDLKVDSVADMLRGLKGTKVEVDLLRDGKPVHATMVRDNIDVPVVTKPVDMGNDITYIRVKSFARRDTADELQAAMNKFPNTKAFAIDVRNNPGVWSTQAWRAQSFSSRAVKS